MAIFRSYSDLDAGLGSVIGLVNFACENVDDREFAATICKKIVRDLRALADKFEAETKE